MPEKVLNAIRFQEEELYGVGNEVNFNIDGVHN